MSNRSLPLPSTDTLAVAVALVAALLVRVGIPKSLPW
jgi:hypothetical protein